jgi:16S rRNA (uracil1498-N3)-methyltransferase
VDDALRRSAAHVVVADVAAPELDDRAWHHLSRVLRLRAGDDVTVTDGQGRWRVCRVAGQQALEPASDVRAEPAPAATTVIVAPPKGDRLEWLVQKCTEVGVGRIVLVQAERSVVRWDDERAPKQLARLAAIAAEAAMQARRVWLPTVEGPVPAAGLLASAAVAEPDGRPVDARDRCIAVGPEGGWTPGEVAAAGDRVSLGPNILRVETAAVVAATLMAVAR